MPPIRTALVGLGRIAVGLESDPYRYKPCTHVGALYEINRTYKNPPFLLEGVCDLDTQKARLLFSQKGSVQNPSKYIKKDLLVESDFRRLLKKAVPELLVIATWTESHVPIAKAAIKAGVQGIVLEKPVGLDYAESLSLYKMAKKYGTRIWINFERRYHPAYLQIKKIIESGRLGELRSIRGRVLSAGSFPPDSRGALQSAREINPLLHDGIHWLDLLLWYIGTPARLAARIEANATNEKSARKSRNHFPTNFHTIWVHLDYGSLQASLECGGRRNYFEFAMELDFSEGRILAGNEGHFYFRSRASKKYAKFRELAAYHKRIPFRNPWLSLYREVEQSLRGKTNKADKLPTSSLESALAGMRLYEQILRAAR